MRIPTSVMVMSVLTAVPFGLAIRDTLTSKPVALDDYSDDFGGRSSARKDREALAEYEAEMAREAEERARKREFQLAQLDELYGDKPASMGSWLSGLALGAEYGSPELELAQHKVERLSREGFASVAYDYSGGRLASVAVELAENDYDPDSDQMINTCGKLRNRLVAAWGPSAGSVSIGGVWLDPGTSQRANLDQASCTLTFDRYLEPADWLAALSIESVGKSGDKLFAQVQTEVVDDLAEWVLPGLGAGSSATRASATTRKGRIIGMEAFAKADFDSALALRDAISKQLGAQPTTDEDTGAWTWKKKVPVTLVHDDYNNRVVLRVGKQSWE